MCEKRQEAVERRIDENMTVEEAFERLDVLVERLEDGQTSLEDSFVVYKEGMELLRYCNGKIDQVEKRMLQIDEDGVISEF
ncbi:MAG: exodeoxyribonuclease VII small subunit [Blautia sp.]